jgi:uncharacterized protein YgbK (DUF1537 family)
MPKLLIIADDLTGAGDTGAQFAKKGIPVFVATGTAPDLVGELRALSNAWAGAEALVVNTESRHLPPEEAARKVKSVVEWGRDSGLPLFYKKIDSSLRGNVGAELEAMMATLGKPVLPLLPAFPALKRVTKDGHQFVEGRPLHETAFARDPLDPIRDSHIPTILGRQTRVHSRIVKTADLRTWDTAGFAEEGIYVFDAESERDLRAAGELLRRHDLLDATAGSAGFAEHLPELLGLPDRPIRNPVTRGPMLVVNGSVNEVSLKQLSFAGAVREDDGFVTLTLPPECLTEEDGPGSAWTLDAVGKISEFYLQGKNVILRSVERRDDLELYLEWGRRLGLDLKQLSPRIARNLGAVTRAILARCDYRQLVVFGGDTLVEIARALGWSGLRPQREVAPGVAASRIIGKDGDDELLLVTKAGGFGPEDVLLQIKTVLGGWK